MIGVGKTGTRPASILQAEHVGVDTGKLEEKVSETELDRK
jgi:hypothetical protein